MNQESLRLKSIIGYNGNARDNLVWHAHTGFFAYTVACNVIVENLNNNHQTILTGKFDRVYNPTHRLNLLYIYIHTSVKLLFKDIQKKSRQ